MTIIAPSSTPHSRELLLLLTASAPNAAPPLDSAKVARIAIAIAVIIITANAINGNSYSGDCLGDNASVRSVLDLPPPNDSVTEQCHFIAPKLADWLTGRQKSAVISPLVTLLDQLLLLLLLLLL